MKEIVLEKKKNGMAMLLIIIFGIILSVAGIVIGGICIEGNTAYFGVPLLIVSILAMASEIEKSETSNAAITSNFFMVSQCFLTKIICFYLADNIKKWLHSKAQPPADI